MTPEEKVFLAGMVKAFQPVSQRVDGIRNEERRLIRGRTKYTAQHIRGAEFMPLSSGGHLLLGHQSEVRARANFFLRR